MKPASNRGFTLIELLVVVVVLGVISAIAIPTLVNALDRGRQKRTMADIKTLANAIESYSVDTNIYPNTSSWTTMTAAIDDYLTAVIADDGWGHPMIYESDATDYTIGSTGKDGGTAIALTAGGGATNSFNDDIVYANGSFVQWPEGVQSD